MGRSKRKTEEAFKKGMEAGALPCEEKFIKQAECIKKISENFENSIEKSILPTMNSILDTLDSKEKEDLLGICTENDIKTLDEDYKEVLINILYQLLRDESCPTDHQKNYIKTIQKYLDIPVLKVQNQYDVAKIRNINLISVQKTIAKSVMELLFLKDGNYEFLNGYGDLFNSFSLKLQDFDSIRSRIDKLNSIDPETIIAQYGYLTEELLLSNEDILENSSEHHANRDGSAQHEMEDAFISTILHVPADDSQVFCYKNIHISSFINCDGKIEFVSCIIYYNESNLSNKIVLGAEASISFKGCTFICMDYDESVFIEGSDNVHIVFENCIFENCSNFLHTDYHNIKELLIKDCYIENCWNKFIRLNASASSDITISGCIIIEKNISSFNQKSDKDNGSCILFDFGSSRFAKSYHCSIINNTLIESSEFASFIASKKRGWTYFKTSYASISHCTFINSSGGIILDSGSVQNCHFRECSKAAITGGFMISHCLFEHCTDLIHLNNDSTVSYCTFLNCFDQIIDEGGLSGGNSIENCEFINLSFICSKKPIAAAFTPACINFSCADSRRGRSNTIKKCIFDSINLKDAFLIRARINEKPNGNVLSVSECDFRNCSVDGAYGGIIKTTEHYFTRFNKTVDANVIDISSCKGLDKVSNNISDKINTEYRFSNQQEMGSAFAQTFGSNSTEEFIRILENTVGDLSIPIVGFTVPSI